MKLQNILLAVLLAALICGCSKKDSAAQATDGADTEANAPEGKKYPFEKGIIHQETEMLGMKVPTVIYFDKWGDWEATETTMSMGKMMGEELNAHTINIIKGDEVWEIDLIEKTGTYSKITEPEDAPFSMLDIRQFNDTSEFNIEELGTEEYLGYKCKKMKIKNKTGEEEIEVIAFVYGTMTMKIEGETMGMKVGMSITKIEKVAPPAEKFKVPEGIVITGE